MKPWMSTRCTAAASEQAAKGSGQDGTRRLAENSDYLFFYSNYYYEFIKKKKKGHRRRRKIY